MSGVLGSMMKGFKTRNFTFLMQGSTSMMFGLLLKFYVWSFLVFRLVDFLRRGVAASDGHATCKGVPVYFEPMYASNEPAHGSISG